MSEHSHEHHSHHHKHRHHRHHKKYYVYLGRRVWERGYIVRCVLIAFAVIAAIVSAFFLLRKWESGASVVPETTEQHETGAYQKKTVEVDGVLYQQRSGIDTYLYIGVDTTGQLDEQAKFHSGQGDTQIVLVVDHIAHTWQVLQINRDTMTNVPVIGMTGKVIGTTREQIALAYAYGTGREDSCRNAVRAVSGLLWNQDFMGYLSMNIEGISVLNDALGGVEVTIESDFSKVDSSLVMGETIRLKGKQAETFVRSRGNVDDETNISRMKRQKQYLMGLRTNLAQMSTSEMADAFRSVSMYTVSSISELAAAGIAEKLNVYEMLPVLSLDGTLGVVDGYAAFEVDPISLQNTILQLFYEPVK